MKLIAGGLLALCLLGLVACLGPFEPREPAPPAADTSALVEGSSRFAFALYGRLRGRRDNLLFSPCSISATLAMTSAGARGKTLEQMQTVLHLPEQKRLHAAQAYLNWQLGQKRRGVELHTANALWVQQDMRLLGEFVSLMRGHYRAGLQATDFVFTAQEARRAINLWAEKQTRERVKELVPPGALDASTRLFLANAVYFQGAWQKPFGKAATAAGTFTLTDGTAVAEVPMMAQKADFPYQQNGDVQVLEMPYVGGELGLVILLPTRADGLAALEERLSAANVAGWLAALRPTLVRVSVPKVRMARVVDLRSALFHMGMSLAFGPGADLTGMAGDREGLFISAAVHQAAIDVHEEGTEAAAATGVAVAALSMDATPQFTANRPFVFLIRDRRTGCLLFLGRVLDPRL